MKVYKLGNSVDGFGKGQFSKEEIAFNILSHRLIISIDNSLKKEFIFLVYDQNKFKQKQWLVIKREIKPDISKHVSWKHVVSKTTKL